MKSILAVTYMFWLGFLPKQSLTAIDEIKLLSNTSHVHYELGLELFDCVKLYTGEKTWQEPMTIFAWKPYQQKYYLGAEWYKSFNEKFNVKVGLRHECQHPVASWGSDYIKSDMASTELYLSIGGKINVF